MIVIPGLSLHKNWISPDEAQLLIEQIDGQLWMNPLKRKVQHYGYVYDYKRRNVDPDMFLGGLPEWLKPLAQRLYNEGFFPAVPDQCIVNEYFPGQGISSHVDCEPCFGDVIASLSLLSACVMEFSHIETGKRVALSLPPRSLLVMTGDARYLWKHGIPARKTDRVDGVILHRARRVSATFRRVIVRVPKP